MVFLFLSFQDPRFSALASLTAATFGRCHVGAGSETMRRREAGAPEVRKFSGDFAWQDFDELHGIA